MSEPTWIVLSTFAGLKTVVPADRIARDEASKLTNLECSQESLLMRKGYRRVKTAKVDGSRPVVGYWRAIKVSTVNGNAGGGTRKQIVHTRNKLWSLSGSSIASITGGYVMTSGWAHTTAIYRDAVYGGNGVDTGWSWTFSGKVASYSTPSEAMQFVEVFEEKLVFGRGLTQRNRFEWTDEGLPTTRQTSSFAFYPPDRTDDLTLMKALGGEIVLGTRLRIGKTVGGLPPRAVIDIDTSKGCVSQWSAATLAGWLYFVGLGPRVFRTDGNVVQDVAMDLDLSDVSVATPRMLRGCGRDGRFYDLFYISVAGANGFPDSCLTYDSWTGRWYGPHTLRLSAVFEWRTPGDDGRIVGGTPSGYAVRMWTGNSDAGAVIVGTYEGPIIGDPNPSFKHSLKEMEVHADQIASGSATLGVYVDRKTASSTVGTVALAASGPLEGDRDNTTVTRAFVYAPVKAKFQTVFHEFQPRIRMSGKGRPQIHRVIARVTQIRST